MNVVIFPAEQGGCGHYRLIYPGRAVTTTQTGVTVTEADQLDEVRHKVMYRRTTDPAWVVRERDELVDVNLDADVAVFQRIVDESRLEHIAALQARGVAVVVDVDDDLTNLPKGHPYRLHSSPYWASGADRTVLARACRMADLVTVTTPALAAIYGAHGRVAILPNCVPGWYLDTTADRWAPGEITVGWTGSTVTHVRDLEVVGDGVARALADTGARFVALGTGVDVARQLALDPDRVETTGGWVDIARYPAEYARFDVAIVPLQPNPFNEAKSWLKGIEAAAVGVPFVASPTGPYRELRGEGAGVLAATPDEWHAALVRLITDAQHRAKVAAAGRHVARRWTYEANAGLWVDAWEAAAAHRARQPRPPRKGTIPAAAVPPVRRPRPKKVRV